MDNPAELIEVLLHAEKLFARLVVRDGRPAVAALDGIDEDEVGEVEPGVGVVDHLAGGEGELAAVAVIEHAGSERADLQISRARAGSAVEGDGDRAARFGRAAEPVGDIEDLCRALALVVGERDRAGGRGIGDVATVEPDRMRGDRVRGQGVRRRLALRLGPASAGALLLDRRRRLVVCGTLRIRKGKIEAEGEERGKQRDRQRATGHEISLSLCHIQGRSRIAGFCRRRSMRWRGGQDKSRSREGWARARERSKMFIG